MHWALTYLFSLNYPKFCDVFSRPGVNTAEAAPEWRMEDVLATAGPTLLWNTNWYVANDGEFINATNSRKAVLNAFPCRQNLMDHLWQNSN